MNKEQKILSKLIAKYRLERSDTENGKWWWIIKEPNRVFCEVYSKRDAEQILRLLCFDDQTTKEADSST